MCQVVVERSDPTIQPWAGGMIPTKLYSRNADVDTENERCLAKLPDGLVWRASKWSERPVYLRARLLTNIFSQQGHDTHRADISPLHSTSTMRPTRAASHTGVSWTSTSWLCSSCR
jgi:hypothetical protein